MKVYMHDVLFCLEPHWTEVLTEILLSFLAQSSHLLRQVVDMVFPSIAPHLTQEALEQLINVMFFLFFIFNAFYFSLYFN